MQWSYMCYNPKAVVYGNPSPEYEKGEWKCCRDQIQSVLGLGLLAAVDLSFQNCRCTIEWDMKVWYKWTYLIICRVLNKGTLVCFKILCKRLLLQSPYLHTLIKCTQITVRYCLIMLVSLVWFTYLAIVLVLFRCITFPISVLPPSMINITASGLSGLWELSLIWSWQGTLMLDGAMWTFSLLWLFTNLMGSQCGMLKIAYSMKL